MFKKSHNGFSLIEILVAMGLMVVIAGVGIPTYKKHFLKTKSTEAKSALGNVYMAEKSFFLEYRFYTSDLITLGITPNGERLYNIGFKAHTPYTKNINLDIQASRHTFFKICGKKFDSGLVHSCAFRNNKNKNGFEAVSISNTKATVTDNKFTIEAIADIISRKPTNTNNPQKVDIWHINQYKVIEHIQNPGGSQ